MLASQRELFDIPRDICYLNSASYSPLPLRTQEAARAAVGRKGAPWTLDAAFANRQHERARAAAARLINAEASDVALISSVSYGVATVGKILAIPAGMRVLVLENDHSSPILEWQTRAAAAGFTIETVRQPPDGDWTSAVLAAIERPGAPRLALASISSVHWSDGGLIDIAKVGAALKRQGALFLIDATHAVGVLAMDVKSLDPDFVIFPTYKWLLGPYGRAFIYIAKRHQNGIPLEQTGFGRREIRSDARDLFRRCELCPGRPAFRHGRARSFHLDGNGRDRHGDDGRMGRGRGRRAALDAHDADRGRPGRQQGPPDGGAVSCAAHFKPWFCRRPAGRAGRGTGRDRAFMLHRGCRACASRRMSSTTRKMPTALWRR